MSYKQRVLLVNKFYYPRGGDCIQMMGVERLLRQHGHEVAVFSMQYPENNPTEYSRYFPEKVDFSGGVKARLAAAARIFGYGGVKEQFEKLLRDFTPDVVHLHNIHSYISPVVAEIAKKTQNTRSMDTARLQTGMSGIFLSLRRETVRKMLFRQDERIAIPLHESKYGGKHPGLSRGRGMEYKTPVSFHRHIYLSQQIHAAGNDKSRHTVGQTRSTE